MIRGFDAALYDVALVLYSSMLTIKGVLHCTVQSVRVMFWQTTQTRCLHRWVCTGLGYNNHSCTVVWLWIVTDDVVDGYNVAHSTQLTPLSP